MEVAIAEARKGLGRTSPNPAVGAIIVQGEVIVGRGYHKKAGTPHAEVHALAAAGDQARGATLYVTLEPCNHTGRTPPCSEAVLRAGIARVVIGMADPNPRVAGGGAEFLARHGLSVRSGVLEAECRALNHPFLKHSATGLPWVVLKAGLSLDGRITLQTGQAAALTGPETRRYVHELRNQLDVILIGVETALIDDPSLTTRLPPEVPQRDPLRVILDSRLRLSPRARLLRQRSDAATWVCCTEVADCELERRLSDQGARVVRLPADSAGRVHLPSLLRFLGDQNLISVLVEGGAQVHGAFWSGRLVDELVLAYAPIIVGDAGTPLVRNCCLATRAESPILADLTTCRLGEDILVRALVQQPPATAEPETQPPASDGAAAPHC